ncbi:substrate-binding domain-containing protein [Pseudomonas sp. J452]|uniref:substrate-binding domain-containing protein n=1 Tax=Pseudomonas sp. J452 TaxID=2898441 RepID=UPI0021AD6B29|nr:substrate-binding domain-containing protein [Pseudomonas sp. J452]UUY10410.1 substrate-binding domain-containing protein [Pseudomonas sp. J452]
MPISRMTVLPIRWFVGAFALLPGLLLADCINMVSGAGGHTFWRQVQLGAEMAAQQNGLNLHFRGPQSERDPQQQLQIIDKVLERPCAALIVAPSGNELLPRLAALKQRGVTILFIDRDLDTEDVSAVVATDNYQAGLLAGQQMARLLKGEGRVALLRPSSRAQSVVERARGFIQGAGVGGLQVVLERYLPANESAERSSLARELGELDGVFSTSEAVSLITLGALRRAKVSGQLVHIGFDANPQLVDALRDGHMAGLLIQQPYQMGYQSVVLAQRHLRGEAVGPRTIALAAVFVERSNLEEERIQRLLSP